MLSFRRLVAKLQALQSDNKEEYKIDPFVELYLNPNCKHTVTIRASLGEMWAQMVNIFVHNEKQLIKKFLLNFTPFIQNFDQLQVRFYGPMIAPFTVSVLLLGLSHQIKMLAQRREGKYCKSIEHAIHQIWLL